LVSVVVDATNHIEQARWWSEALETPVTTEAADEAGMAPPHAPRLDFVPVPDAKASKNRVHFDLATYSAGEHDALVARLLEIGARPVDVGQPPEADWVVLADPEGNEFCVMRPRPDNGYSGRIGEIGMDTASLPETAAFWARASGWDLLRHEPAWAVLRDPSGRGPYLFLVTEHEPKVGKNRIHLDVAPNVGDDHQAAVDELVAAGAHRIDIGQGSAAWVVLADPGGNELCVLTPR
jgi:hypothetical protein